MSAYATLQPEPTSPWISPPAAAPAVPSAPSPAPTQTYLPSAPRNGGTANVAMIAASLGMGDYLPSAPGASTGAPAAAPAPSRRGAPSAAPAPVTDEESGVPSEVLGRVGFEFDHDGGYRYRITASGGFEIIEAPEGRGIGSVLLPDGALASAWKTLADYIVAMGPAAGAPKTRPSRGKPASGAPSPGAPSQQEPSAPRTPTGGGKGGSAPGGSEFLSQRDNDFDEEGCNHDNQCTPTSATMAILARMSTDAFYQRAQELFADQGATRSLPALRASQPEDVVIEWLYLYDPGHGSDVRGSSANVIAAIEAWTGQDASDQTRGSARETLEGVSLPGVVGTWLTTSGHTVEIIERTAQGIVINDPYGSCRSQGDYLRHGESGASPPAHRWSRRPDLASIDPSGAKRDDWGRANFFTWDEAETYSIGKWAVSTS